MSTRVSQDSTTTDGDARRALEEFAPEERITAAGPSPAGPEVSSTLMNIVPATPRRDEPRAFLSRLESLKARRSKRRRAPLRQFVNLTTAFREWMARMSAAFRGASRSGVARMSRVRARTSSAVHDGTGRLRRTSLRLASRGLDATKAVTSMTRAWWMAAPRALAMPAPAVACTRHARATTRSSRTSACGCAKPVRARMRDLWTSSVPSVRKANATTQRSCQATRTCSRRSP